MKLGDRWYLSRENLEKLFSLLESLGFVRVSLQEIRAEIRRANSVPYLKKEFRGNETGYVYKYKHWKIFIWTTYVETIDDINEEDLIWGLVTDDRSRIPFFWFPMKRTMNFVQHVVEVAEMLIECLHLWPRCTDSECDEPLYLIFVRGTMHLMQYVCGNHKFIHSKDANKFYPIFDLPLSDKNSKLLYETFQRSLEYQHKISLSDEPHEYDRNKRAIKKAQALDLWNQKYNFYGDNKSHTGTADYDDGAHIE